MKIPFCGRRCDAVDAAAAVALGCAALFAATFFWQASAGAARGEASFREEIHRLVGKRIMKERSQIAHLLALEEGGNDELWQQALADADRYRGNSQFHLLLGGGYAGRDLLAEALAAYRLALEQNREYGDRRSPWYRGEELELLVARAKKELLDGGGAAAPRAVSDLFYIERSLAGGCH